MTTELIAFLVMVGVFLLGCFLCNLPVSLSMVLASVAGAIAGGQGLALRHLVEGMFAYVDTIMVIATAMIFMKVIQESGALDAATDRPSVVRKKASVSASKPRAPSPRTMKK